jgi:type I restriction enzyme S subunit
MTKWKPTPLGQVLRHRKGSITIDDNTSYKLCRVQVHRRGVVLRQHLSGAQIRTKNQQVCRSGDFLIAEMDAKVGGYGFVPPELDGAIVSSHYYLFEVDKQSLYPPYLEVVSQAEILQRQIVAKGSTNYASVRPSNVLAWHIPLPEMEVQKRVARNFQAVQGKLATARGEINRQQSLLSRLKQALLQKAILGKLTTEWRAAHPHVESASDLLHRIQAEKRRLITTKKLRTEKPLPTITADEIPFEIPKSWEWCRYGMLCEYVTSGSRGWQQYYSSSGALFIRAQNIKTDKLELDDEAFVDLPEKAEGTRAKVQKSDILITITGGNLAKTAVIEEDFEEAYVSQHIALTRLVDTDLARWVHQALITEAGPRGQLLGFSRGDKPGLNLPNVRHVLIPLPPIAEQVAIVERVEALMTTCRALEAEIERSRTHAAHLLQAVLNEAFAPSSRVELVAQDESAPAAAVVHERIRAYSVSSTVNPKVIPIAGRASRRTVSPHSKGIFYRRAALDCYVIEQLEGDPELGRTKLEKISHLLEHHCAIDLEREPIRDAAGPNDYPARIKVESLAKKQEWYTTRTREGGAKIDYLPGPHISRARSTAANFIGDHKAAVDALLAIMRPLDTKRAEVVATLYASWNDFLLAGKTPTDDELVQDVRTNWHPRKELIPIEWWLKTLSWMRRKQLLPTGSGKPVTHKLLSAPRPTSSPRTAQNKTTSRGKRKGRQ